jgi:tagatose 6-phosphate kinase
VIAVGGFNSAIDKFAETESVTPGAVMRLSNVRTLPGGKGLHVALACATLGERVTLVGIVDAASRAAFHALLEPAGVRFRGVSVDQPIRTCLAVRDARGGMTELLESGPQLSPPQVDQLTSRFLEATSHARYAVLSGSLPAGMPSTTYARLITQVGRHRVLLDASGESLVRALDARPLAVKPNRQEAAAATGRPVETRRDAVRALAALAASGVDLVLLSLGADGALLWDHGSIVAFGAPPVQVRNTVGAGDCLLAGFAVGLARGWSVVASARYGVASGTAKVQHADTGLLRRDDVEALLPLVAVEDLAPLPASVDE